MAYCSDAIIAPTCISPASMRTAPNQRISTLVRFIMRNMAGISSATRRLTVIAVPVTSWLAASNRRLCSAPRSKARITRTPVRPSSSTRLSRSILTCICWNSGTAFHMIRKKTTARIGITAISTRASSRVLRQRQGDAANRPSSAPRWPCSSSISSTCCTCVVSLVVRVISEAVLNWSNWCTEKCATRSNTRAADDAAEAGRDLGGEVAAGHRADGADDGDQQHEAADLENLPRVAAARCRSRRCRPSGVADTGWRAIARGRGR